MTSNNDSLNKIADQVGIITEEQNTDGDGSSAARDGEEFDTEDFKRKKEDYDGGW